MEHTDLLHHHITVLGHRIAQAQAAEDLIEHALSCPLSIDECLNAQ